MPRDSKQGRNLPVTARGLRTRQQLLDAAEAVFAEHGFERAAISEITRGAGVALGTFYVHFPNKEAIFVELVEQLGHRLRQSIAESVAGLGNRLEVEKEGFRAFFQFADEHRGLYRIIRQAEFVDEKAYRRYYRRIAQGYRRGLERAMARGEIAPVDGEVLAYALMGMADFLGMRFAIWRDDETFVQVWDQVGQLLTRLLGRDGRGGRKASPAPARKKRGAGEKQPAIASGDGPRRRKGRPSPGKKR